MAGTVKMLLSQIRPQPFFNFGEGDVFPTGVVLELFFVDFFIWLVGGRNTGCMARRGANGFLSDVQPLVSF